MSVHNSCVFIVFYMHWQLSTLLRIRISHTVKDTSYIRRAQRQFFLSRVCMSWMAVLLSLVSFETLQVTDVLSNRSTRLNSRIIKTRNYFQLCKISLIKSKKQNLRITKWADCLWHQRIQILTSEILSAAIFFSFFDMCCFYVIFPQKTVQDVGRKLHLTELPCTDSIWENDDKKDIFFFFRKSTEW